MFLYFFIYFFIYFAIHIKAKRYADICTSQPIIISHNYKLYNYTQLIKFIITDSPIHFAHLKNLE